MKFLLSKVIEVEFLRGEKVFCLSWNWNRLEDL